MSTSRTEITVEGHNSQIMTEQTDGVWRAEVVNSDKSSFAFDPTFDSEAEAVAHASNALLGRDILDFLG